MAAEWNEVRLGELGEVNRGRSRHRPRNAPHLYGGEYPFIQTGDIKASNGLITAHSQTYSEAGLAQSRIWPEGTMVITIAANIAETAILTYPACFPDSVVGFIADERKADVRFIEYLFRHLRRQIQHENVGTGSVQDNINLQTLDRLALRVPELPEQSAIAHILGTLDDKIELNRRRNQTLEAMARALFKDWFVDFGPVRAKMEGREPYLPADLWELFPDRLDDEGKPEGWQSSTLASFASLNPESWTKKNAPDDIRYVDLSNTKQGNIEGAARMPWSEAPSRAQRILRPGDTIVGTVRPGNKSFALIGDDGMTGSTGFAVLRPLHKHSRDFVFLAATSPENIERLTHLADGAAYPAVRPDVVLASPVTVPPGEIVNDALRSFANAVSGWVDAVEKNKQESKTLAQLRDTLLPKLISGELRIKDAERFMEGVSA